MQRTQTRLRIGFGLVAMVAVLALVALMTMVSSNGGATPVSATGSTPTAEPNPGTDGFLSGIDDLEVLPGPNAIYHCINRTDHDAGTNRVKTSTVCYVDIAGTGDPSSLLNGVNVPGEGPQAGAGPAPPPPYTIQQPNEGAGDFFPGGSVDCGNVGTGTCMVTITCFPDLGAGSFGPNMLVKLAVTDPGAPLDSGTVQLVTGMTIKQCDNLDPTVFGAATPLPIGLYDPLGASPAPWRTTAFSSTDFDGDGCTDLAELDLKARPKGCGDDPYNPDSNKSDFGGSYDILVRVVRADLPIGGSYFSCLADIQQDGNGKDTSTSTPGLEARAFCYTDSSLGVNLLGYPTVTGDGYPGGGPAWGAIPADGPPETNCDRFGDPLALDEDGDTVINDGCPEEGLGDTDSKQTILTGFVDNADNTLKLRGCFEDEDASSNLQNVYVELEVDRNTGVGGGPNPGGVNIWALQSLAECAPVGGYAYGDYSTLHGPPLDAFTNVEVSVVRQPGAKTRDTDQDGCPNASELGDDPLLGGLRDPYNPYDWYDVNQDGIIDLFTDILGVISHYSLDGSPPYDANWDRGAPIVGGAGSWSRKGPDGIIDLFTDILGVISQYSLTGC